MLTLVVFLLLLSVVVTLDQDYYALFGMTRNTFDKRKLSKAYKKLAKDLHPDKRPDDPQAQKKLMEITEAYYALNNDEKRAIYDRSGVEGLKNGGTNDFNADDIFEQFFGKGFKMNFGGGGHHGHYHQQRRRTPDSRVELKIPLEDAYKGAEMNVKLNRQKKCDDCNGIGADKPEDIQVCSECKGSGMKVFIRQMGMAIQQVQTTCERCGGRGKSFKSVCKKCKGQKVERADETLTVKVPKGCPVGHTLKYPKGADEAPDYETGDLYITLSSDTHPVFRREGGNLYTEINISLIEALLGFTRLIKSLDGRDIKVSRQAVTQPLQVIEVEDEGMGGSNYLFVTVKVILPEVLSKQQKALFQSKEFSSWKEDL